MVAQGVERVDIEAVREYAKDLKNLLEESEITERKAFLRSFVSRIVVNEDKVRIEYRIPAPKNSVESIEAEVLPIVTLGGAEGTRTPDLLTASQTFSQLNYSPTVQLKFSTNTAYLARRAGFYA